MLEEIWLYQRATIHQTASLYSLYYVSHILHSQTLFLFLKDYVLFPSYSHPRDPSHSPHLSPRSQSTIRRPTHATGRIQTNIVRRRAETIRNQRRSTIIRAAVRRGRGTPWRTHLRRTGRCRGRRSSRRCSRRGGR